VFGYTPSAGLSLGGGLTYIGRIGPAGTTRLSQANVSASYSTNHQLNLSLTPTLYLPDNRFSIEGDLRYLSLTQITYGLGPLRPDSDADNMGFNLLRFYVTGYASVAKGLYIGLGYRLDHYFNIVDHNALSGEPSPFLDYNNGETITSTTASGIALSAVYETRDNPINASHGYYARLDVVPYLTWLGNTTSWTLVRYDARTYVSLDSARHTILAFWIFGWLTSAHPPYLSLPAIGWDRDENSGRGYVQGQIRGPSMLYGETEVRHQLTADGLLGGVLFASLTAANYATTRSFGPANPAYGFGLRLKLNKKSNQNVRFDLAFTPTGHAQFFLGASEVF
jgi:outer membrane protein assembly factor BamA